MKFTRKVKRELFLVLLVSSSLPLMYMLFMGSGGYVQLRAHQNQLHDLQLENIHFKDQNKQLQKKIERLKNDPAEVERIAREDYNFAQPGDVIITLPKQE